EVLALTYLPIFYLPLFASLTLKSQLERRVVGIYLAVLYHLKFQCCRRRIRRDPAGKLICERSDRSPTANAQSSCRQLFEECRGFFFRFEPLIDILSSDLYGEPVYLHVIGLTCRHPSHLGKGGSKAGMERGYRFYDNWIKIESRAETRRRIRCSLF